MRQIRCRPKEELCWWSLALLNARANQGYAWAIGMLTAGIYVYDHEGD